MLKPVLFADWSAPIVPVLKSDKKSVRICGDFSVTVNQVSRVDSYPRSPTKAVCGMTPHEAWTGEKLQVDGLRIFGCQAFVHVPKDEKKKLDSKSRKCILLGYGMTTKGY